MQSNFREFLNKIWGAIKHLFTTNVPLKVISILFAVVLWAYVLYDVNPYRSKAISGVKTNFEGEADLLAQGMCVRGDRDEILKSVDVEVSTQLKSYRDLSAANVNASISLRQISAPGEYTLPITASVSSSVGYVEYVSPSTATLEVDYLISKTIPVSCEFVNELPTGYWADKDSLSYVSSITIEGPQQDITRVAKAVCKIDLEGRTSSIYESFIAELYDESDNLVDSSVVRGSVPATTVRMTIKPFKVVPVDIESALVGVDKLPANYVLESAVSNPSTVRITGDEEIIKDVNSLTINPFSVSRASEPVSFEAELIVPDGVTLLDDPTVSVTLDIHQKMETVTFVQKTIVATGLLSKNKATIVPNKVDIEIYGPASLLSVIKRSDLEVSVDVSGLADGTYELPISCYVRNEKITMQLSFTPSFTTAKVTIR